MTGVSCGQLAPLPLTALGLVQLVSSPCSAGEELSPNHRPGTGLLGLTLKRDVKAFLKGEPGN